MKARQRLRASLLIALLPAGFLTACSGKVSLNGGTSSPPAGSGTATGSTTGSGNTTGGGTATGGNTATGMGSSPGGTGPGTSVAVDTGATPTPESAGVLIMRRLNLSEYDNILADLLGDTSTPAEDSAHPWGNDPPNADSGFESATSIPDQLVRNFSAAAETVVETALTAGKLNIPCTNPAAAAEAACVTQFINTFGLKVFRRPLDATEVSDAMTLFTTVRALTTFNESVAAIAKGMLQTASFLYHWEIGPTKPVAAADGLIPLTPWQIASRLASNLWNSKPDDTLLQAAQAGQLATPTQVAAQAQRLIADPKHLRSLTEFHGQWLFNVGTRNFDLGGIIPLGTAAGTLTQAAIDGLPNELSSFLGSVYSTGDGTMKSLLTAPWAFVNKDLAAIYGVTPPATAFGKVMLDPSQRGGLFTQTAFLASFSYGQEDHPIYRGLSLYTKFLCGTVTPPNFMPPGVPMTNMKTSRQTFDAHGNQMCAQMCHAVFDPPGFAFENYDGAGRFRMTDNGFPVDSTGSFATPGGTMLTFTNALDLMGKLAALPETALCAERQWTRYMLGRKETQAEVGSLQLAYQKGAATAGFSLRDMLTALVTSKAYMYRTLSPGETP